MNRAAQTSPAGGGGPTAQQEFQLETRHLVLLIALVVVLCAASFELGRWVERQGVRPTSVTGSAQGGSTGAEIQEAGDVAKELTFFDTLKTDEPVPVKPEVGTTVVAPRTMASAAQGSLASSRPTSRTTGRRSVNEGVMIQVFASKERGAADSIRKKLRAKGYTAILITEGGSYKVRVGPYADREEAERSAAVLQSEEHLTTWIP